MAGKHKAPAFQFYADDWLSDEHVRLMTLEETGAYIDAIAICWREGSIPADPVRLARLIGKNCSTEIATQVQLRFNISSTGQLNSDARLEHKRLNLEREKQHARSEQMRLAGKKSASMKSQHAGTETTSGKVNLSSTQVQPKYNSSSSSSDEDERSAVGGVSAVAGGDIPGDGDGATITGKQKRKRSERAQIAPVIPKKLQTLEFLAAWEDWQSFRKEIRHPLTPTQAQKQLDSFATWGSNRSVIAINFTIMKGWRGIAEPGMEQVEPPKQRMPDIDEILERGYNPQAGLGEL